MCLLSLFVGVGDVVGVVGVDDDVVVVIVVVGGDVVVGDDVVVVVVIVKNCVLNCVFSIETFY